jgi:hypothetical protein
MMMERSGKQVLVVRGKVVGERLDCWDFVYECGGTKLQPGWAVRKIEDVSNGGV